MCRHQKCSDVYNLYVQNNIWLSFEKRLLIKTSVMCIRIILKQLNISKLAMIIMIWLSYFIIIQDIKLLSEGQLKYKNKIKIVYKWTIFCPMGHSCADMFFKTFNQNSY
jgi:hypothetical protein